MQFTVSIKCFVCAAWWWWAKSMNPSVGPQVFWSSNQRNRRTGSMRQGRKMVRRKNVTERKAGHNFSCVINFKTPVPHSLSLKPLFLMAPGQRLLTSSALFLKSLGRNSAVTFQAMCLWRNITSWGRREKSPNQERPYFTQSLMCLKLWSSLGVTSNIRNVWFTGGGKGGRGSYLANSNLHYNTTDGFCPEKERKKGGWWENVKNLALTTFVNESRNAAVKSWGGVIVLHSIWILSPAVSQLISWWFSQQNYESNKSNKQYKNEWITALWTSLLCICNYIR